MSGINDQFSSVSWPGPTPKVSDRRLQVDYDVAWQPNKGPKLKLTVEKNRFRSSCKCLPRKKRVAKSTWLILTGSESILSKLIPSTSCASKAKVQIKLVSLQTTKLSIHFHWKSVLLHLAEGPVQKHTLRRLERKAQDPASFKPTNSKSDGMNSTDHFLQDRYLSITPLMNILSTAFLSCVSAPCVSSFLQRNTLRWTIRRLDTCANMWHSNTSAARSEGQTAQQVFPNLPFLRILKSQNENKTSLKFGRFRVSAQTEKNNSKATFMERDSFDDFHLQLIKRSQVGPAVTGRPRHP